MKDPGLRASDEDRQRVVASLERHTAAGRLSLDEFSERVGIVYASATFGELALVTRDLPAEATAETGRGGAGHPQRPTGTEHRQLLMTFVVAIITLAVLGIILGLAR